MAVCCVVPVPCVLVACAGSLAVEARLGSRWDHVVFPLDFACRIRFSVFSMIIPLYFVTVFMGS
jgi:hypothetical protein